MNPNLEAGKAAPTWHRSVEVSEEGVGVLERGAAGTLRRGA